MRRIAVLLILFGVIACNLPNPSPGPTPSPTPAQDGLNIVVSTQGMLGVKRDGWNQFAPALFGTELRRGDLLKLDASSQATIACADLTVVSVPAGTGPLPCKAAPPLLQYQGKQILATRASSPGDYPFLVTPRTTKLLDPHPLLRWTAVPGASDYRVSIQGQGLDWSADAGSKTELRYPDTAPALVPGRTYQVIISANGHSSDDESTPGRGFTLVPNDQATMIRATESKVRNLGLGDSPTRLLIADLYRANGLDAEAIDGLETLSGSVQEPAVSRQLGDLYVETGVIRLAEVRYLNALDLSQKENDVEGEGWAEFALGQIYQTLGNKAEATARLEQAVTLYGKLGDQKMLGQIQPLLDQLKR